MSYYMGLMIGAIGGFCLALIIFSLWLVSLMLRGKE